MASDFADLLSEAEKLTQDIEGTTDLPKVDRSLRQVLEASNDLYTRVAHTGAKDIQANILLGQKGIDLPRISQKLEQISTVTNTLTAVEPIEDVNIEAVLRNEIQNCIMKTIEEEHKQCYDSIMGELWEHELGEWKQEKRKILNAMVAPSGHFIHSVRPDSVFTDTVMLGNNFMSHEEVVYAKKIMEFNRKSMKGEAKPNMIEYFADAAAEIKDKKVNDMWEIMKYMTQIEPISSGQDPVNARTSKSGVKELTNQARQYLENRYKTYMSNIVNDNLRTAQRGGIPGTHSLVKSFVSVRLQGEYVGLTDGTVDDRPLWPMIYFCMRSGDIGAAYECLVNSNVAQNYPEVKAMLEAKFKNPKHADIQKLETAVRHQYRRFVRNDTDPFKRIVWAVCGCCDITDEHSEVAKTADDWLWLKLNLVRDETFKEDRIDYFELQRQISEEYGESHYDANNQPHMYFQVLALTGQFEAGIEFLSRIDRYKVHAVHMAIALNEMYLLGAPKDYSAPLVFVDPGDQKPTKRLNIVRLILLYVRRFEMTCTMETIHYFYLLQGLQDGENQNMFTVTVTDLAIETRDFDTIFGKILPNGVRSKGVLDEFRNSDLSVERIAKFVGDKLYKKGMFEEAIHLYDLANNQTEVLNLACQLLSQVIAQPSTVGSLRDRLALTVKEIYDRYTNQGFQCSASTTTMFCTMRDLLIFFDLYHSKNYAMALKCLGELKLIPLYMMDLDDRVNNFRNIMPEVTKVFPDILLATMNIYFAQYQKLKENEYMPSGLQNFSMDKQLANIREQAKVLTNYTGMLPYRMPGDTNSRLVQMEILMH